MNTIQAAFEECMKEVYGDAKIPPIVRSELRQAFYSGASAVLRIYERVSADADMSDAAGVAIIDGLHEEVRLFVEEVAQEIVQEITEGKV